MVKKYLISDRFGILDWVFSSFFNNYVQDFFIWFKMNGLKESVILPSYNGRNELLKGENSCTYIF